MFEEKYINLNGRKFRYLERQGVGCKLLFLHGLSDSADQFLPIASRLPEDWHLLALDQRGHGSSWKPKLGYTPIDYAHDIKDFIHALSISSLHIFGHTTGKIGIPAVGNPGEIGVGLITSFAAREVMVNTLATLYNVEEEGDYVVGITEALKNDVNPVTGLPRYTPLVALSIMVFYVYAAQCMATIAIVRNETNNWKWPLIMILYMTILAYAGSLEVYQGGLMLGFT